MAESILELIKLQKIFGGVVAVNNLVVSIEQNTITSIIGPNGAGKTTIFNLITGFLTPTKGSVKFLGNEISGKKPHYIASSGISRTFQNVQIFSNMTAVENVMVGRHLKSSSGIFLSSVLPPVFRKEEKSIKENALKWLSFVGMEDLAYQSASSLPLGNQRLLEIARALAMEPKLILLDEPASGLNARETLVMGNMVEKIKQMNITVILVEHDMGLVMDISDKIVVINFGTCIAQGIPKDIQTNPDVIAAYLGE